MKNIKNILNTQNVTEGIKLASIFALAASPLTDTPATLASLSIAYYLTMSIIQNMKTQSDLSWAKTEKFFRKIDLTTVLILSDLDKENILTEDKKKAIQDEIEDLNKDIENFPSFLQTLKRSLLPLNGFKKPQLTP